MALHILYSDVHVKRETLPVIRHVFNYIGEQAVKLGVVKSGGYLLNNGDLFDQRGMIPTSCWDVVCEARSAWREMGIKHIDNIGNHDQEDREGEIHPLKIFESFEDWHVCTKPTFLEDLGWVIIPYTHALEASLADALEADPSALFVHAGIKSAFRNDKSRDTDGISIDLFRDFKMVFSGHYHFRHEIENVQYIGSTHQHSHAEMGQDKGFILYNDKTGKRTFHEIPGTPKHFRVELSFNSKGKLINEAKGEPPYAPCDKVKCHITGRADQVKMVTKDQVAKLIGHERFSVERSTVDEAVSRLSLPTGKVLDHEELLGKYIDFVDPSLDKKKLFAKGKELLG